MHDETHANRSPMIVPEHAGTFEGNVPEFHMFRDRANTHVSCSEPPKMPDLRARQCAVAYLCERYAPDDWSVPERFRFIVPAG